MWRATDRVRCRLTLLFSLSAVLVLGMGAAHARDWPILVPRQILAAPLPDLAIKEIALNRQCSIVVTVENRGPGRVPDTVWTSHTPRSSSVYLKINGRGWGGATIWGIDPKKQLQIPGGEARYTFRYVVGKEIRVEASVDHTEVVSEADEVNNRLDTTLTCRVERPAEATVVQGEGQDDDDESRDDTGYWETPQVPPPSGSLIGSPLPPSPESLPPPSGSLIDSPLPPSPESLPPPPSEEDANVVRGELLLVSRSMTEAQEIAIKARELGLNVKRRRTLRGLGLVISVFSVPGDLGLVQGLGRLREILPQEEQWTAGANHRYVLQGAESDRRYGATLIGWHVGSPDCGRGLRLGLIDTAIDITHPSLKNRSISTRSFVTTGLTPAPAEHGTAVAALLVGDPHQGGAAGLLPGAVLYSANVFRQHDRHQIDTTAEWIILALDWLLQQRVQFVNLSLGGPRDLLLETAIKRALERGIVVLAAAGNNGPNAAPVYPAAQSGVIAVTAVDARRQVWPKANRGTYISFAAPGVDLWTARPGGGYGYVTGTSYSVPFVTAALAETRRAQPKDPPTTARRVLAEHAYDLGDPGKDLTYGWGLVQAREPCSAPETR